MPRSYFEHGWRALMLAFACALVLGTGAARAEIPGIIGTSFALTAKADRISTPDGNSIYFWGFAAGDGRAQYPGPTLIIPAEGQVVTVSVTNALPANFGQWVSIAFAGQQGVTATCTAPPCAQGAITMDAGAGGTVTYQFTAARAGTFLYNSASRPDLQVEMGLTGAMIVRPSGFDSSAAASRRAYAGAESRYDQEYLFFLTDMDSGIHDLVESQGVAAVDQSGRLSKYNSNYWFINGRNAPDTMADAGTSRLPTQPYNSLPRTHPGDRLLMRVVGGGHQMHPFHHHGNHARVIAVDGVPLETTPGSTDLSYEVFTIPSMPGQSTDAIFRWTGKDIGWDIYGGSPHTCGTGGVDAEGLDLTTREYCGDHGKPIPVTLPDNFSLTFGGFWSGSPYLDNLSLLPPGQGGLNPNGGYTYMWHSHNEKEITNFDVFPGGMMTMLIIEPLRIVIP